MTYNSPSHLKLIAVFIAGCIIGSTILPATFSSYERIIPSTRATLAPATPDLLGLPLHERMWVQNWTLQAVPSIVSQPRKSLTLDIAYAVLKDDVPGDFVETGVYTGGTSILLMKALQRWDTTGVRKLWAADSFEGLPEPTSEDAVGTEHKGFKAAFAATEETFRTNMQNWDAHDTKRLEVLKGWFSDSLPHAPIKRISYLRLDGDLYASTMDALTALYDKVSIGGFVYVDDYGSFNGCREAIYEFRTKRGIVDPLFTQYFPEGSQKNEAVAWRKTTMA